MFNIKVIYHGENLSNFADKMPQVVSFLLAQLGVKGEGYAKRLTPVNTGGLRKSIKYTKIAANKITIGSNKVYAPYILLDTPPYTIKVKNKKALAWMDKGCIRPSDPYGWYVASYEKGIAHYTKKVRHPGGKNVMGKTVAHLKRQIPGVVKQALNKYGIL